jgi:hypothetical protein
MDTQQPLQRKTCNVCDVERDIIHFATYFSKSLDKTVIENRCRLCKNEIRRKLMAEKAAIKKVEKEKNNTNKEDIIKLPKFIIELPKLTEKQIAKKELIKKRNRDRAREKYAKTKDTEKGKLLKEKNRLYKYEQKDKINATRRKYLKEKMKDPHERIKRSMKTLLLAKIKKNSSSTTYFGTSMDLIFKWLEFNFTKDINWENYGKYWQIDHTIPVNLWDMENNNEVLLCFNWKNLMPLQKMMNLRKASHLQPIRVFYQEQKLYEFYKKEKITEPIDDYLKGYRNKFRSLLPEFYMRHTSIAGTSLKS